MMKQIAILIVFLELFWLSNLQGCVFTVSEDKIKTPPSFFVGSTPCDSLIRSMLQLPGNGVCEFIKWELKLYEDKADSSRFEISILYGESQPNTNGFKNGGRKISLEGRYKLLSGAGGQTGKTMIQLQAKQFSPFLSLIKLDENILHFTDTNNQMIVGNGGFGYVLNKINSTD